jgi:hypothetical protein
LSVTGNLPDGNNVAGRLTLRTDNG